MARYGVVVVLALAGCSTSDALFDSGATAGPSSGTGDGGQGASGGSAGGTAPGSGGDPVSVGGTGPGPASGGGPGSGGAGGDVPCAFGMDCGPGSYCDAPGCGMGLCKPLLPVAQESAKHEPRCGCDGVIYWNETVAQSHGMSIAHEGECGLFEDVDCSNVMPCPQGAACNQQVNSTFECQFAFGGTCWALPATCDPGEPHGLGCLSNQCVDQCTLIKGQGAWYTTMMCQ
jgi:hypothetical protein